MRSGVRAAVTVAAAALVIRALVLFSASVAGHLSIERLAEARDGGSYLRFAAALRATDGFESLRSYDRRVFPGYPAFLAGSGLYSVPLLAMIVNWLAAAGAAVLSYVLFKDVRIGWAMAVLTPSYVMYSTVVMTEPLVLLLGLGALYCGRQERQGAAGTLLGLTAVVRPLALPLGLACVAEQWKSPRRVAVAVGATVVVILLCAVAFQRWSGSLDAGWRVYATDPKAYGDGPLFAWPFTSLIRVSLAPGVALWKIAYVWLHVVAALGALVLLARDAERRVSLLIWHGSNVLLVLCVGGVWGFHELHRLLVPSLPPMFWAYRRILPSRSPAWIAIGMVTAAMAAKGLSHGW